MGRLVSRKPVEININSPLNGYLPIFDGDTKLWETISTASLFNSGDLISGSEQVYLTGTTGYNEFTASYTDLSSSFLNLSSSYALNFESASFTGSFKGDGSQLYNIPFSGVTGLPFFSSSIVPKIDSLEVESGSIRTAFNSFTSSYTTGSFTGSFKGDGSNLYNITSTAINDLNKIVDGNVSASISQTNGFRVNTDVYIDGTITAREIHTDYVTSSVLFQSGSTKFGNSNDDTHQFTGSLSLASEATSFNIVGNSFGQTYLQSLNGAMVLQPGYGGVEIIGDNAGLKLNGPIIGNTVSGSFTGNGAGLYNIPFTGVTNLTTLSSSISSQLGSLETESGSIRTAFNSFTSSYTTGSFTGSFIGNGAGLYNIPSTGITNLNKIYDGNATASISQANGLRINTNTEITGSLIVSSGSATFDATLALTENSSLILNSGSNLYVYDGGIISGTFKGNGHLLTDLPYATTASNTFNGSQTVSGSVIITQDLTVLGSSSIVYVTSSQLDISTNIIKVNASNPGVRYGGLAIIDSGSSPQVSGSFLFDSQKDEFVFIHQSQGVVTSSVFLLGPETYDDLGNETYLTQNRIPKGSGIEHLYDSNITDTGAKVSINSNTEITGSLTVVGSTTVLQDLTVNGTAFYNYVTASTLLLTDNWITVTTTSSLGRFGGIRVLDYEGVNETASLAWDTLNDRWMEIPPSHDTYSSSLFIMGPKNSGSLGDETGLTTNYIPKADDDHHIIDSAISDNGTTISLGRNSSITGSLIVTGTVVSETTPLVSGSSQINITGTTGYSTFSSSLSSSIDSLSSSIASTNLAQNNRLNSIEGVTGSYATTGSNQFKQSQTISGSLIVTGTVVSETTPLVSGSSQINITGTTGYSTFSSSLSSSIGELSSSVASTNLAQNNRLDSIEGVTGSYATTGSNHFKQSQVITGSLTVTSDVFIDGIITAREIHTDYVTSSVLFQSGSTKFGDTSDDIHQFTGSVNVNGGITGSLFGTSSYAVQSISSSYPLAVSGKMIYTALGGVSPATFDTGSDSETVMLGYRAGLNTTGSNNGRDSIYIGAHAGENTDNYASTLVGAGAGSNVDYNSFTTIVGGWAGTNSLGTNAGSTIIGVESGQNTRNSQGSTFLGNSAGNYVKESERSTILGGGAGGGLLSSSYATIIGYGAASQTKNSPGSILMGGNTGEFAISGSYSIVIGNSSGRLRDSGYQNLGRNNIIIGTNIALPSGRNDSINIGGVLFGTGSSYQNMNSNGEGYTGFGSSFTGSLGNGKIGINVVNPQYNLDVSGSGNFTNGVIVTGSVNISGSQTLNGILGVSIGGSTEFQVYQSGVTIGSVVTDTHRLTGSLSISGSESINGTLVVSGSAVNETPTFGSNLLTSSGWGTGINGWTGDYTNGWTVVGAGSGTMTNTYAATSGVIYGISITATTSVSGKYLSCTFGGTSFFLYFPSTGLQTITAVGYTTTTGTLSINASGFDGTISGNGITIKTRNNTLNPVTTFASSTGTNQLEIRVDNIASSNNTFIGKNSGKNIYNGTNNISLGNSSLENLQNGTYNVSLGNNTLQYNYSGNYNTAVGNGVLSTLKNSDGNSAIGYNTLNQWLGSYSTALGSSVGSNTTTGQQNIAIGSFALSSPSTSTATNYNVAIGVYSLGNIGSNIYSNTSVGTEALRHLSAGNNNTVLGYYAGKNISGGGTTATNVDNSIFIGYQAYPLANSQTNQIVIGYQSVGLGSNTTVIGNSSTVTSAMYGNLLLGTTISNGADKLQVSGSSTFSGSMIVGTNGVPELQVYQSGVTLGSVVTDTHRVTGSVNISGSLGINNTVLLNQNVTGLSSGNQTISTTPTASYTSAFYNYTVSSGSNARAGQIMVVWNGSSLTYTDNSTMDIGLTKNVELTASLNTGNVVLSTVLPTNGWTIKTLVNLL